MSDRAWNVAIYWDFENIQASLVEKKGGMGGYGRTKFQAQEALIDVDSVMEYAATFGVVSINRAYCNWQWYGKYREALLRNGLELIQLFPPGASAKNGGDIKLALDCTEDLLRFPHLDIVVIVGGDSDYLPLAQKVKAMGKNLVGIGTQANTNRHWARSCHEFKFYEALILDDEPRDLAPTPDAQIQPIPADAPVSIQTPPMVVPAPESHTDQVVQAAPEELLRRAIRRLSGKTGDAWVLKGSIRPMLKRLDPTFEEEQHGARSFSSFIRRFEHILEVRAGRNDQEIRLRAPGEILPEKTPEQRDRERSERHREERDRERGDRQERGGERQERNREGERFERGDRERGERHERNRDRDRDNRRRNERFGPDRPLDLLVRPAHEGFNSPEPRLAESEAPQPVPAFDAVTESVKFSAPEQTSPETVPEIQIEAPAKEKPAGRNRPSRAAPKGQPKAPAKEKAQPKPVAQKPKKESDSKPTSKPRRPAKPKGGEKPEG
ncbi:MAG: hypothetical protein RL318_436 [Fibrobacterota bacterium]|jgi:uncharacterized protein (TIGR00288 family)